MSFDSNSVQTIDAEPSPAEKAKKSRRRRQRCNTQSSSSDDCEHSVTIRSISEMIEQIQRFETILAVGLVSDGTDATNSCTTQLHRPTQQISSRLLAKVKRLDSLHRIRCQREYHDDPAPQLGLDWNNNKCCNGTTSSNAMGRSLHDAEIAEAPNDSTEDFGKRFRQKPIGSTDSELAEDVSMMPAPSPSESAYGEGGRRVGQGRRQGGVARKQFEEGGEGGEGVEGGRQIGEGRGRVREGSGQASDSGQPQTQAFPKHQDYCLCHKRKCQRCGCLCPCSEHACPSCGYASRVVMTMRAVDGLKAIANAQKARYRNGRMATMSKCKPSKRKQFLLSEANNECSHAVMVRVGGGFVPLVEYLKSHNKVVLSKFTRGDGSAYLSPWRPYYPGPLKKGRPRGIRYVDSVTQQLEEIIFANKEAGKSNCICP